MRKLCHAIQGVYNRLTLKANSGPISIGIIGVGGWGASNAVAIMRSKRFNIVGVHDIREEVSRRFTNRFHVKCYKHSDDLLADSAIQAVCITVPNHLHMDLAKKAADAKKHVFIEKPLASYPDECKSLGAYCEDAQVVLQVGHQMRREPVFREIKHFLETGNLGDPLFVQGVYTLDRRTRNDWRQNPECCPGGSMEQLGIHLLDVLAYFFGAPLASQGWSRNFPPDWCEMTLQFPKNLHATIHTSFSSINYMQLAIFFDKGRLATDGKTLFVMSRKEGDKTYRPRGTSGSVLQFREFADCIEQGVRSETSATEAAIVMEAVHSMRPIEEGAVS